MNINNTLGLLNLYSGWFIIFIDDYESPFVKTYDISEIKNIYKYEEVYYLKDLW